MRSPNRGYELRQLEGDSSGIWDRGDRLILLSEQMSSTGDELAAIGDSSVHCSKGTDKLAEMASETSADLASAATRYELTGRTLRTYGTALAIAQDWIHPRIDDIEAAERRYEQAQDAKASADSDENGLDRVWPWEDEPTDAQRSAASAAVRGAAGDLTAAEGARDELWEEFETRFGTWSDAYDDAVNGIQKAMDTAGNNDGFWEFVDDALKVLGRVILALSFLALIIGAPLFGALGLVILALTALVLAVTLLQFAFGKAALSDVAWSTLSLVPFGLGKVLSRGIPTLSQALQSGRGAITTAIRSELPPLRLLRPSTWSSPVRSLLAPLSARAAAPHPGLFVNPLRSMGAGSSEIVQIEKVVRGIRTTPWASHPAVARFLDVTESSLPSAGIGNVNRVVWGFFTTSDLADLAGARPDIPVLDEIRTR